MSLVDDQKRAVTLHQLGERVEGSDVAIHAEEGFGDDEGLAAIVRGAQEIFQTGKKSRIDNQPGFDLIYTAA